MPNESYAHCIAFGQGINTCTRGECASGRSTDPVYAPRPVSLQETWFVTMRMRQVQRIQWIIWNVYKECKKKTNKHVFANRYYQNGTHIRGEVAAGYMV
jgi:hypothetical protein